MRLTPLFAVLFALLLAAPSSAAVPHVVQPGETLWSIAAANNLTTRTVAAFNGLSENSQVVLGSTVQVPSTVEGYAALQKAGLVVRLRAAAAPAAAAAAPPPPRRAAAPQPLGGYTVRPGDTLSGLAASSRVSVERDRRDERARPERRAARRHRDQAAHRRARPGARRPARARREGRPGRRARADATRLGAGDVQSVASQHGVSPSLATAIAWQESGFNNAMVSSANARGVMQVMPGTWDYVQQNLATRQLDPNSAHDNVTAGVLYLKSLLNQTGGDESAAIAAYYQGLGALRSRGVFDDTKQYVANVQALRARFGG